MVEIAKPKHHKLLQKFYFLMMTIEKQVFQNLSWLQTVQIDNNRKAYQQDIKIGEWKGLF